LKFEIKNSSFWCLKTLSKSLKLFATVQQLDTNLMRQNMYNRITECFILVIIK